jgi:hypothetical protein
LTREAVLRAGGECPEIYGDPALLLPRFHNAPVEKTHTLGVVPHYVDTQCARLWAAKAAAGEAKIVDILHHDPIAVVDEIRACEMILTSSLHALIVAQAYGIPAIALAPVGVKLAGDGTKFLDYFMATGQAPYLPAKGEPLSKLLDRMTPPKLDIDLDALYAACPFGPVAAPLVVSYYTPDYAGHAERFARECEGLGLDYHLQAMDPIGDWIDNTRLKAEIVAEQMRLTGRAVVWIDVDSSILAVPELFTTLDADFAAWRKGERSAREWSAGVLWFNNTPGGRELCEAWVRACARVGNGISDEWALHEAWLECKARVRGVGVPKAYFGGGVIHLRYSGNAASSPRARR